MYRQQVEQLHQALQNPQSGTRLEPVTFMSLRI
jgi:hypothetical protein